MPDVSRPVATVLAARKELGEHENADHAVMRLLVDRLAAHRRYAAPAWAPLSPAVPTDRLEKAAARIAKLDMTGWDVNDLGSAYEHLLGKTNAWYTPVEVAECMVRLSIGAQLDRLSDHPDPGNVLEVLAVDPACGAGVFLVAAARLIARRYAERLLGEASPPALRIVMPEVMDACIFGIDIDPVAIDLCRTALWLEVHGRRSITFMDRNVICADALAGPTVEPPRLAERRSGSADFRKVA